MGGIPIGEWSGSNATERLRKLIETTTADTTRQNRWLLWMTGAILKLTAVIAVHTAWLVWRP
jgi:hypothetical protein